MNVATPEDLKAYKYIVNFVIDVKRTDKAILTNDENAMVQKMKVATEQTIFKIMKDNGQKEMKHLGSETVIY